MWNNLNNITFFMKKSLFLLLFSICSIAAFAQTKINPTTLLKAGAANTVLTTDASGNVVWAGFATAAPDQSATNEIQTLSIAGSVVSLSLGGGSVTIPAEVDGSITNEIQALSIAGNTVSLSLGGGSVTLPAEVDGSITNEIQALSIAGNTVSLSLGGGSVTLPAEVDGSITNEIQVLSLASNTLSLSSGGGSVVIPADKKLTYVGEVVVATAGATATIAGITATVDTDIYVWRSGVKMRWGAGKDITRAGTTITFATPLAVGETVDVSEIR
jgi:hypothetical protein